MINRSRKVHSVCVMCSTILCFIGILTTFTMSIVCVSCGQQFCVLLVYLHYDVAELKLEITV